MQLAAKEGFYSSNIDGIGMTAITSVGNVWKSFDAGFTWFQITSAVNANTLSAKISNVADVMMSTTVNPGYMYAVEGATGTDATAITAQLYRSQNGVSWERAGNAVVPAYQWTTSPATPAGGVRSQQIFETSSRIYVRWLGELNLTVPRVNATLLSYTNGAATSATLSSFATAGGLGSKPPANTITPSLDTDVALGQPLNAAGITEGGVMQGGSTLTYAIGNPTFDFTNPGASVWVYDNFANTFYSFRTNGVQIRTTNFAVGTAPSITAGSTFSTALSNVAIGTYAIPITATLTPQPTGNYYVAGLNGTGNTFYTWTPNNATSTSAWVARSIGTSYTDAPQRVCGTNRGQLIYRTGVSTNEAWWTTDSCATFTSRNLPETAVWRGVFWNY